MRRINQELLQEIRQKVDIASIIGQYISLQKSGNNYKGICPFHDDHDPSLSVNQKLQIYKCFVCGAGGNVFGFVQNFEKISFIEAVVKVASSVGIDLSHELKFIKSQPLDPQVQRKYEIMNESSTYYHYLLKNTLDDNARDFVKNRNLTQEIIDHFKIGYSDPSISLTDYLTNKGYQLDELVNLNLTNEFDGKTFDFFNNRIVFPITNENNQVVAYTARALKDETSKYINSATSDIYQKSDILYNYAAAKSMQLKEDKLVLCEGVMDVIAFYKAGHHKTIASLGTALTQQQVSLIKRLNCDVVLAYDGDKAGNNATYQAGKMLLDKNIKVSIFNNSTKLDPDEFLEKIGKDDFIKAIDSSKNWIEFVINYLVSLYSLTSYDSRKKIVEQVLVELKHFDSLDQSYFLQKLSDLTGFDVDGLQLQLDSSNTNNNLFESKVIRTIKEKTILPKDILQAEKLIIAHLLYSKELANIYRLSLGYLLNDELNNLSMIILSLYQDEDEIEIADILDNQLTSIQKEILLEIGSKDIYQVNKTQESLHQEIKLVKIEEINRTIQSIRNEIIETNNEQKRQSLIESMIQLQIDKDNLIKKEHYEEI